MHFYRPQNPESSLGPTQIHDSATLPVQQKMDVEIGEECLGVALAGFRWTQNVCGVEGSGKITFNKKLILFYIHEISQLNQFLLATTI